MSVNTDYDPHLAEGKITNLSTATPAQYGQSLQVRNAPGNAGLAVVAKDLARWKGKSTTDIQPIRIYLGPWQPVPGINLGALNNEFWMEPTPWMTPKPAQLDAFVGGSLFARISFGAGGVQHQAYVDWPPRGCLLQVSAQYIQVDGLGNLIVPGGLDENLPRIAAHISPEPGGGDAATPATYTYPPVDVNPAPGTPPVVFQVPPFARAFRPLIRQRDAVDNAEGYEVQLVTQNGSLDFANWRIEPTADVNSFNRDDFPVTGFAKDVVVQAYDPTNGNPRRTINVGMIFYLDL